MDDDPDVDTSLTDLHHGLDSSLDESMHPPPDKEELAATEKAMDIQTHSHEGVADDQINMLQDMVLEMKEGFQSALEELTKIQDKEVGEASHSKSMQKQQQRQLDDLTETIHEIKNQLNSLTKSVKQIKDEQKTLKDHLDEVRSNRGSSQDRDKLDLPEDSSSPVEEWNIKLPKLPTESDIHNISNNGTLGADDDDEDIVAIACKSLSLTQSLGEKCLKTNLYQSSDEDEEQESPRMSRYASRAARLVLDHAENRRHSMPANPAVQNRNYGTGSVALRQKAVKDLADSERDYCSQLWSLLHTYLTPLQTAGFLSGRELGVLFPSCIDQMYAEHCRICTGLQDKLVHWTHMGTVADLLARITDSQNSDSFLSLYKEYAEDLYSAVTCLRRVLAQSSEFRSFLKAIKHSSCQSEDLMSLLLAPIQHIPKYLLQIQQVSQHTPPTHPDFPLLQTSLHRLRRFVDQLNEEVSDTIHALNQDRNSGQKLSTRDSGVHSNSTEDDAITSGKDFSKARRRMPSDWLEDPYGGVHHRQSEVLLKHRHMRASAGRLSTLSQPDLTVYKNLSSMSSDPQIFTRIPRSHSTIPTGSVDSSDDAETGRQYRKFKVKRRTQSPASYSATTPDHHYSISHMRPSSATDFLSHSYHQQQYLHHGHHWEIPAQSRSYQYPEPQTRPHSAFGLISGDSSHKPIIISRKQLRRSQPPLPTSSNLWTRNATSPATTFRTGHQRVVLSARDMLPKRPSPYNTSDVIDGDDEDEDDTRVSDTFSHHTDGSHQFSISQGSNNDSEVDFYQDQLGRYDLRNLMSTRHPAQFSSAEVAASLARKLYNAQQDATTNNEHSATKNPVETSPELNLLASEKQLPGTSKNKNSRINISEKQIISSKNSSHFVSSDPEETDVKESSISSPPYVSGSSFNSDISAISSSVEGPTDFEERHENKAGSKSAIASGRTDSGETKQVSESNRQFLMSLSSRASNVNQEDITSAFPLSNHSDIHSRNLASQVNTRAHQQSNPDGSSKEKANSSQAVPYDGPQTSKTNGPNVNQAVVLSGNLDLQNMGPAQIHSRHSKLLSNSHRHKYGEKVNPQKHQPVRSHNPPLSSFAYPRSFSSSLDSAPDKNRTASLSLNSHPPNDKPSLLLTSSVHEADDKIVQASEVELSAAQNVEIDVQAGNTCQNQNEVIALEVANLENDGDEGEKKGDYKKKVKDGGKFSSTDGLPKTNSDPVGARKRMHFKSSIKNLFTKKKGRVILADVEKEVVKEMKGVATIDMMKASVGSTNLKYSASSNSEKFTRRQPKVMATQHKLHEELTSSSCQVQNAEVKDSKKSSAGVKQEIIKQDTSLNKIIKVNENQGNSDSTDYNFSEAKSSVQQNMFERLKRHNKRHGVIIEENDMQFTNTLDVVPSLSSTLRWNSGNLRHSVANCQIKTDYVYNYQQRPLSTSVCNMEKSECNKSASSFDKRILDKPHKSQTAQNGLPCVKNSKSFEIDLLKSAPDVCNQSKNKTHSKNGKEIIQHTNISQNRAITENSGLQERETHMQKSHSSIHNLCPQCQKCEMRQKEKIAFCNEAAMSDKRSSHGDFKSFEPEAQGKNFCASHQQSYSASQNGKPLSNDCVHISTDGLFNDLGTEKKAYDFKRVMRLDLNSHSSIRSSQPCSDSKQLHGSDKNKTINFCHLSNHSAGCLQEQIKSGPGYYTSVPSVDSVCLSGENHCSRPNVNNLPDVTKFSVNAASPEGQKTVTEMSSQELFNTITSDLVLAKDLYPEKDKILLDLKDKQSSTVHSNTPLLGENNVRDSASTAVKLFSSLQKISASTNPDCHSKSLPQISTLSMTNTDSKIDKAASDKPSKTDHTTITKTDKDCSQSFTVEETDSDIIVKRLSMEDKDLFEHRYRLYYDDEDKFCRKLPDNPKSLKALSASSVIAENFKQVPRGATPTYNRNQKVYDKISVLTLSEPFNGLPEQNLQPFNGLPEQNLQPFNGLPEQNLQPFYGLPEQSLEEKDRNSSQDFKLSREEKGRSFSQNSKLSDVSYPLFSQGSNICPAKENENVIKEDTPKYSKGRSCSTDLMDNQNVPLPDNKIHDAAEHTKNKCDSNKDQHEPSDEPSNPKSLLFPFSVRSNETAITMKLTVARNDEDYTPGLEFGENNSRVHAKTSYRNAASSDESNSYKPKNPQPILMLSNVPEYPSPRHSIIEGHPRLLVNGSDILHCPISEQKNIDLRDQIPRCLSSPRCNHEQSVIMNTNKSGLEIQRPHSFSSQSFGSDSFHHGFLRTSSPNDLFSIRPYVDFTASKSITNGGSFPLLDSKRSNTLKSNSKGMCSDKLDKNRALNGNRKTKNETEMDNKSCKTPDNYMESFDCLDDIASEQLKKKGRGRLRIQEQKATYKPHYPRYSADSNPLISNAFLQKMAHLSQHTPRPQPPSQDDENNVSSRYSLALGELYRHNACDPELKPSIHSSRNTRTSSCMGKSLRHSYSPNNDQSKPEESQTNCGDHSSRSSPDHATFTNYQASPDLLLSNEGSRAEAIPKERSPLSRKAQLFFSKFTQSPISFFHRDSKPSNVPK